MTLAQTERRYRKLSPRGDEPIRALRAAVVVLGDFGRSPRMQYHAIALAESGCEVDVIAYAGSELPSSVSENPHIRIHTLPDASSGARRSVSRPKFIVRAGVQTLARSLGLISSLMVRIAKPDLILVQNPPAIPTLAIALCAARLRSAHLVIDWHNLGWTMLAMRLGNSHPIVAVARRYERFFGRRADASLCVSRAMRSYLADEWEIAPVSLLYDRPARWFQPIAESQRTALFERLAATLDFPTLAIDPPAIIVCPTSWTADEDIALILEAAARADTMLRNDPAASRARILILITGRGELRARYEEDLRHLKLDRVHLRTAWLSPADYALMLGASALGISCHRSSSGLDLPIKIADLFGAGVPVCAFDYGPCLAEQVHDGVNGLLFKDSATLGRQIYDLFKNYPAETAALDTLRANIARASRLDWFEGWKCDAQSVLMPQ